MNPMRFAITPLLIGTCLLAPPGCASRSSHLTTATASSRSAALSAATAPTTRPARWALVAQTLGPGVADGDVYSLTLPRTDLAVTHPDFGLIPPAAGLASTLHFFPCPCGKTFLVGALCVTEEEANDVLDELRRTDQDPATKEAHFKIASLAPLLLSDRPKILSLRFEAEGTTESLLATIKKAQRWMRRPS